MEMTKREWNIIVTTACGIGVILCVAVAAAIERHYAVAGMVLMISAAVPFILSDWTRPGASAAGDETQ